jgi:hypothetical protein
MRTDITGPCALGSRQKALPQNTTHTKWVGGWVGRWGGAIASGYCGRQGGGEWGGGGGGGGGRTLLFPDAVGNLSPSAGCTERT